MASMKDLIQVMEGGQVRLDPELFVPVWDDMVLNRSLPVPDWFKVPGYDQTPLWDTEVLDVWTCPKRTDQAAERLCPRWTERGQRV